MVPNRLKFLFAGPVLELANPRLPGHPHERLLELVPEEAEQVLEICAGTGFLSRMVAQTHPKAELHALDISPEMLSTGRRRAAGTRRITFVEGDAGDLPFADDQFDVVLAAFGLHELPTDVRARAIDETARVLRPLGHLLAVDIDKPEQRSRIFSAYMRFVEKPHAREVLGAGLSGMLEGAGFDVRRRRTTHVRPVPFQLVEAVLPSAQPADCIRRD